MKNRIRERLSKTKGAGLPWMIRKSSHRGSMRSDTEFTEEYGEGFQTVDRVRKTKSVQNVHQGDSAPGLTTPGV